MKTVFIRCFTGRLHFLLSRRNRDPLSHLARIQNSSRRECVRPKNSVPFQKGSFNGERVWSGEITRAERKRTADKSSDYLIEKREREEKRVTGE